MKYLYENNGHKVLCLETRKKGVLANTREIIRVIRKENIDIVSTHLYPSNLWGPLAAKLMNKPVISSLHSILSHKGIKGLMLEGLFLRLSDKIRVVADVIKKDVKKYYKIPQKKIVVIKNGRSPEKFTQFKLQPDEKKNLKHSLGLSDDSIIIGMVASLTPQKGHVYLLNSFTKIKQSLPEVKLLLVGDGILYQQLHNITKERNISKDVIFAGNHPDVRGFIDIMDIFILSSIREGLCNVLIEAMMMKKPIIATNVGGNKELIKNKENGMLIEPYNTTSIAEAVISLYNNKTKMRQFGEKAQKVAVTHFDINRKAIEFQNILLELVRSDRSMRTS